MTNNYVKRKICIITGTRAEYGLLKGLISEVTATATLQLQIIATGMHLSPEFGLTYKQIEEDGFNIDEKIEILLSSDTSIGVSKSVGLAIIGFAEAFARLSPDLIVILGDRFEILAAASAALIACIPLAHIYGGESTQGAFDDSIRHAITKMSHLHFPTTETYRKRIIQMGEKPSTVYNFGSISVDTIRRTQLMSKNELENNLGIGLSNTIFLVTYHPETLAKQNHTKSMDALFNSLDEFQQAQIIFTLPNADTLGRSIINKINNYVGNNKNRAYAYASLGSQRYLSLMSISSLIIGNSSSGILEAPIMKVPSINIGDRQKGRLCAKSVTHCSPTQTNITAAINKVLTANFANDYFNSPYGEGDTSREIINILKKIDLTTIIKKEFYDIR